MNGNLHTTVPNVCEFPTSKSSASSSFNPSSSCRSSRTVADSHLTNLQTSLIICHRVNRCVTVSQCIGSHWLERWHGTPEARVRVPVET